MNIDQSIHRMAMREADTLGLTQVLIVKKRQELDLRLQREQVLKDEAATGASLENALKQMDAESRARNSEPVDEAGVLVDKTA